MRVMGAMPAVAQAPQVPNVQAQGAPAAARPPAADGDLRVGQMNLWNLFEPNDSGNNWIPTPEQYQIKLEKIAKAIIHIGSPDIISLQEIENEKVLTDLLARPELAGSGYKFIVQKTNDLRDITVGMLYKDTKLEMVSHQGINTKMSFPDGGRGQVDTSLLYARPPLVVDFKARGAAQAGEGAAILSIAVNHFKSKLGGEGPEARRQMQGQYLGEWLDAQKATNPGNVQMVFGDLNALYEDGAYQKLERRADGTQRLYDAPMNLPEGERYSYIYRGQKNLLDHAMVSMDRKDSIKNVEIPRLNTPKDAAKSKSDPTVVEGYSDHDSITVDFDLKKLLGAQK